MSVTQKSAPIVNREDHLRRAVVRILDRGLSVIGTGFLVTHNLVATCAHVVNEALRQNDKKVCPEGQEVEIRLLAGTGEDEDFVPTQVEGVVEVMASAEDVAFLRLKRPLPDGVVPLALASSDGLVGLDLRGFGFPKVGGDGLWMTATVVGPLSDSRRGPRFQVRSTNISPGCSGGPLWDERGRVVGVAVAIVDQEAKTGRHTDTAMAIAAEVLVQVCRELTIEPVERSPAPLRVPFQRNLAFVGREYDLEHLHRLLQHGKAADARPVGLNGMGGVGKTQIAVEYAYRYRAFYPCGVYWINAAGGNWKTAIAERAESIPLSGGEGPESERQSRLVHAFQEYLQGRPDALVIFDNVDDPADLQTEARAGFVPGSIGCRVLFTTCNQGRSTSFENIETRVLPLQAALGLLLATDAPRQVIGADAEDEHAEAAAICRMLGCLPLALVLAAAYLRENSEIPLADYRARLEREGVLAALDDTELDEGDLATRHPAAVGATLRLQWNALEAKGAKSEEAKSVLQTAAVLGEAVEVPRARLSLLTGLGDRAEAGHASRLGLALRRLRELSLVEELREDAIRLHPLVREFVAKTIERPEAFKADCAARLGEALREMGRLHEEVARRRIDAVLGDLRVGSELAEASGQARFEALIRPLDREAHALRGWDRAKEPGRFLQQLRNRCFELGIEEVRERAEAKIEEQGWAWIRERIRTSRESEALVRTLEGHAFEVTSVAVTANGCFAVSASLDSTLKVWDLGTGQAVHTLEGHTSSVLAVAVTANGHFALSASEDKTLKVWDLGTGQAVHTLEGHTDGVTNVAANGRFAVAAFLDRTLKVWDLRTGKMVRTLEGHTSSVLAVAVTADGRFAISASWEKTLTVKVWDLGTGQAARTLEGHAGNVTGVALTPDGRFAIAASDDLTLRVWELSTGRAVGITPQEVSLTTSVAVTKDDRFAITGCFEDIKVWDLSTMQVVQTLKGHTHAVTSVAVTTDRRFVSASKDKTLKVWDLSKAQPNSSLGRHHCVTGVALMANGRFVLSASHDSTLKMWDLSTAQVVRTFEGHTSLVNGLGLTTDGLFAVSASNDMTLKVWDLGTGQAVRTLEGHGSRVCGVAVTADGRFAISASWDKTLKVWDLGTGQAVHTLEGHTSFVLAVAVTADDRFAVSASSDHTLKVWELSTGRAVRTLEGHDSPVCGVAVTADSRFAVSASEDKTLKVWDLGTGQAVHILKGHTSSVLAVAVTVDGHFAVSSSEDKTLKVWNLQMGQPLATLETHAPLLCCNIMPDGKTFLAGDRAGALHVLDWRNGSVCRRP